MSAFVHAPPTSTRLNFPANRRVCRRSRGHALQLPLHVPRCSTAAPGVSSSVEGELPDTPPTPVIGEQYEPKVHESDPIAQAINALPNAQECTVAEFEHLDTRWNGNEAYKVIMSDGSKYFLKFNRVEDPQVFMSEAVSLTEILQTSDSILAPRPLHIGQLPKVGMYGPGAFMVLTYFDLAPFGAQRPGVQAGLGRMLAALHDTESSLEAHKGRFGFRISNYLGLTPMHNSWEDSWAKFFANRLARIVSAAYKDKAYGRAALSNDDDADLDIKACAQRICRGMNAFFDGVSVKPSLLHGDLWIGNVGATKSSQPLMFDPACFYGHDEFDLALPRMFGGYNEEFWNAYFEVRPKQQGFEKRAKLYELYQYFNQLNLFGDPEVKDKIVVLLENLDDATA